MRKLKGISLAEGIAYGTLKVYQEGTVKVSKTTLAEEMVAGEKLRFLKACMQLVEENEKLYFKACGAAGENEAGIFDAYRLILEDETFKEQVCEMICDEKVNAEYAVAHCIDAVKQRMKDSGDAFFAERAEDVEDIKKQFLEILQNDAGDMLPVPDSYGEASYILMADTLTPMQTMRMNRDKLLGIVVKSGSKTSHTAILARAMGIPALSGIETDMLLEGKQVVVDGNNGVLIISPDENALFKVAQEQNQKALMKEEFLHMKGQETVTKSGKVVRLYANAGRNGDIDKALSNDAEGIGLLRSEFLYMQSETEPDEETLFNSYKEAALKMGGKELVIRTLDIGADKVPSWMQFKKESNPALGLRGIRYSLNNRAMFTKQLRAILRASAYGNVSVMFPMVTDIEEIREAKVIMHNVTKSLANCNILYQNIKVGVMIETPAAVMISDLLAKEVDFFSIGTNDLTQYTLAIDRENDELDIFVKPRHEAVLRMIHMTVENAHRVGCKVSICGEMAADYALTETFIRMGVDGLSVAPDYLLGIRKKIKEIM